MSLARWTGPVALRGFHFGAAPTPRTPPRVLFVDADGTYTGETLELGTGVVGFSDDLAGKPCPGTTGAAA